MSETAQKEEVFSFKTEDRKLLDLVIHSLYSDKDIFLREVISNAADAIAKARYWSISEGKNEISQSFEVSISCHPSEKMIKIHDNGIGMTRDELIQNLGTIAHSGTAEFLNTNKNGAKSHSIDDLIGQFGVGFYSVFMVASKVEVISRSVNSDEAFLFTSDGKGSFTIAPTIKESHGTTISLYMLDDDYLSHYRLRNIIKKYSHYAPVALFLEYEESHPEEDNQKIWKKERINEQQALWLQSKNTIDEKSYQDFYKDLAKDYNEPRSWIHGKMEGSSDYHFLFYIPKELPLLAWQYQDKPSRVKIHVKHIFISDDSLLVLPRYLSFVSGLVDFNDLPLNVSRELLQDNKMVERAKAALTKKVIQHLGDTARDKPQEYQDIWSHFGQMLKMFPAEDPQLKDNMLPLLRFHSSQSAAQELISLDQYLQSMPEDQKEIYYITASTWDAAMHSPHMDYFKKKGWNVLLLIDRVDESLMNYIQAYQEKNLVCITQADLAPFSNEQEEQQNLLNESEDFCKKMTSALAGKVKEVRISKRLVDSPCCLVVDHQISLHMQRLLKDAGQDIAHTLPILEINPHHPLIAQIEKSDHDMQKPANFLYSLALLAEGGDLSDPASFSRDITKLLNGVAFQDL